jgi:ABC-type sugar transport system ATPase subunit
MDEPLSSLDKTLNRKLRKEIIRLQEKFGFTLVYVTHNEEEAEEIGTRIITLDTH